MRSHTQFQINQLRQKSVIVSVESIAVFGAALFVSSFLPSLLVQYYFGTEALLSRPMVLEYIAPASFVFAMLYFFYALLGNIAREMKVKKMEMELTDLSYDCDCAECEDPELAELKAVVKSATAKSPTKSKVSKKRTSVKKK